MFRKPPPFSRAWASLFQATLSSTVHRSSPPRRHLPCQATSYGLMASNSIVAIGQLIRRCHDISRPTFAFNSMSVVVPGHHGYQYSQAVLQEATCPARWTNTAWSPQKLDFTLAIGQLIWGILPWVQIWSAPSTGFEFHTAWWPQKLDSTLAIGQLSWGILP